MAYNKFSGKKRNSKLLIGTMYHLEHILDTKVWLDKFDDPLSKMTSSWDGI